MLKKLLKYNLLDIFKVMIIYYVLAIFFALTSRLFLSFDIAFLKIIGQVSSGIMIAMIFTIFLTNFMRNWSRFASSYYGDESYLSHTLPVEKYNLFLAKYLTSIITFFASFIVCLITLFIGYYSKENVLNISTMLNNMGIQNVSSFVSICILAVLIQTLLMQNCGLLGMILGYKKSKNKILYSVIFGFVSYMICQFLLVIAILIFSIFNKDVAKIFTQSSLQNISVVSSLLLIDAILYTILNVCSYFVGNFFLKNGVNVD